MKKTFLYVAVLLSCLLGILCLVWMTRTPPRSILLITMDTTRADRLGCYGHDAAFTPNLDRLAKVGFLFEQCRASAPLTLPSHATIMTGLQPPEHGLRVNGKNRLADDVATLASILSDEGYDTGAFIAATVLDSKYGLARGFETCDDDILGLIEPDQLALVKAGKLTPYRSADAVVDLAIDWLLNRQKPFFCWVHLYDPHDPYNAHPEITDKQFESNYDAEIAFMDQEIGRLLKCLNSNGLSKHTIVIAVGDHGEDLHEHGEPAHGATLYDSTMRVPLIVHIPDSRSAGSRVAAGVSLAGLFSTVLELVNVDQPVPENTSLATTPEKPIPDVNAAYGETEHPLVEYGWAPQQSVVLNGWKFIRSPIPELYDLAADPGETTNLANNESNKLAELEDQLLLIEQTMKLRTAEPISLSETEKKQLRSPGYAGGNAGDADSAGLKDVKTMLPVLRKAWDVNIRFDRNGETSDELVQACREIIAASPETMHIRTTLAAIFEKRGELENAAQEYSKVLVIDPGLVSAQINLGALLLGSGQLKEAVNCFAKALETDPENTEALNNMGIVLAKQGNFDAATSHFAKSILLKPDDPELYNNLGRVLALQNRQKEAISSYLKAIELKSDYSGAWKNLSASYRQLGNHEEAAKALRRSEQTSRN